nr:hypothetical protein CFP56_01304 [Quercus suber]
MTDIRAVIYSGAPKQKRWCRIAVVYCGAEGVKQEASGDGGGDVVVMPDSFGGWSDSRGRHVRDCAHGSVVYVPSDVSQRPKIGHGWFRRILSGFVSTGRTGCKVFEYLDPTNAELQHITDIA